MVPLLCKSVCQLNVVEYYFGVSSCVLFDLKSRNKNNIRNIFTNSHVVVGILEFCGKINIF